MGTVRDLLLRSFKTVGIMGSGEVMDAEDATDALDILNDIIEQANVDKLMAVYKTSLSIPMVAAQSSYTIGPASSSPHVVAVRPVEILSGYSRRGGVDYPIEVLAKQDYDRISNKSLSTSGWGMAVYYEAAYPKGTLYVYPVPQDTLTTIYLEVMSTLTAFASLDDTVDLPPLYKAWLRYKTAKRLAPEYGALFTVVMESILIDVESSLKGNNIKPLPRTSLGHVDVGGSGGGYNVFSDRAI